MMSQVTVAKTVGIVLLVVGLLGFVPNPIVGNPGAPDDAQQRTDAAEDGAIFGTNALHNIVHLASGLVGIYVGFFAPRAGEYSKMFNVTFGAVYAVVTLTGFVLPDLMRDLLAVNTADNILHLLIAIGLLVVGLTIDVEPSPA